MNANKCFYVCEIPLSQKIFRSLKDLVDLIAFLEFGCSGSEEINIEQETVNKLLREKAVGGGELPEEAILEVEKYFNEQEIIYLKYFFEGKKCKNLAVKFNDFVSENITDLSALKEIKSQDWNNEWKKHYSPISVDGLVKIIPSFYKNKKINNSDEIYIYPGMGFGTGSHETTFMCLQALLKLSKNKQLDNKLCLDFGCGSGILGIAAMKYCLMITDFCDVDKNALDNCLKNIHINFSPEDLKNNFKRFGRDIFLTLRDRFKPKEKYELVFANILENIILEESALLESMVRPSGHLIISGILNNQIETIENRFIKKGQFQKVDQFQKGEWAALLLRKL